ncbi:WD40/YVTN/BNR-like repeat-containing protein [Flaviaesturariibacter terrae]
MNRRIFQPALLAAATIALSACSHNGSGNNSELPDPPDTLSAACSILDTPAGSDELTHLVFTDSLHGYLTSTRIYKTSDGCRSWTMLYNNSDTGSYAALGARGSKATFIDYGPDHQFWNGAQLQKTDHNTAHGLPGFRDLCYASADTVFLASGRYVWRSTDGGATVDTVYNFIASAPGGVSLYFQDGYHGWINRDGQLYRSTDGGASWSPRVQFDNEAGPIQFLNDNLGFMADRFGTLYRTTDGGATAELLSYSNLGVRALHFFDAQNGLWLDASRLRRTTDGGHTWQNVIALGGYHHFMEDMSFTDAHNGWVLISDRRLVRVRL